MTDMELKNIINKLRVFTSSKRTLPNELSEMSIFFLNVIEITCSLTELGVTDNKQISKENEYWFEASYHMNFWDSNIESELYSPLASEVRKRNFFR